METANQKPMTYLQEFRAFKRYLAAASLGLAAGYSIVNYISNIFIPHLLDDFGWTRSELALATSVNAVNILTLPIVGRLTDAYGVKKVAIFGVVTAPLVWLGLSAMTGSLWQFFLLTFIQLIVVGGACSVIVYSRLIAETFDRARGVSLAIAASAAPVAGAISVPFLSVLIDNSGWRAGYVAVGIGVAICGFTAIALIPPHTETHASLSPMGHGPTRRYREIFRITAFKLIAGGVVLCNLSFMLQTAHLKLLLLDRGIDSQTGSMAISLFAGSVIFGRMLCGVALDRFPAYLVTAIALGLPGIGLAILATGTVTTAVIAVAVLLLGLSLGAEGDVLAFIVRRYFRLEIFSTVLGLVISGLALSVTLGSLLLSLMLKLTDSYDLFMIFASVSALAGGVMLFLLRREQTVQ